MRRDPMFKIGEFSKLSRISIRMLRHYDEIGLLVPEETDPWTGYRRYAAAQLMTANRITALRGLGFSLAETAALLACWEDRTAMETRLLAQRAAVEASIQEALDRLRLLDTTIERLRKDEKQMNYDVTIKTLPERQVASVRQILPCYDREGDLWHIFVRETALLHIQDGDPALCISVYHDGEYKEADVDVEIQKTVKLITPSGEYLKEQTMKYFETHLPSDTFVRVHRSTIVNVTQISRVELFGKETYQLLLKNGVKLRVSLSGYRLLKERLGL